MTITTPGLNLVAVIVTGIAIFLLGGLWYMALFGKLWQKYNGYSDEQVKAMQASRPPHIFFGTMLFAYWILATLMGFVIYWVKADTWMDGLVVGLVIWGIVQAIAITSYISGTTRKEVYFIDGAYQFCYLILAGIMLTVWK
jgi:hypothetical protein